MKVAVWRNENCGCGGIDGQLVLEREPKRVPWAAVLDIPEDVVERYEKAEAATDAAQRELEAIWGPEWSRPKAELAERG